MDAPGFLLRHVVVFRLAEGVTPEQVQALGDGFCTLREKIDAVYDLEWGADVSVEGLTGGYTHCLLVTFINEVDRDAYLSHPTHEAVVTSVGKYVAKTLVIDYWAKK